MTKIFIAGGCVNDTYGFSIMLSLANASEKLGYIEIEQRAF